MASDNMPADVARAAGYVERVRHLATGPYAPMAAELAELAERLQGLHLAALALDGWCPTCGAALTDPAQSPSGARHCRACRVGWELVQQDGRLRAVARAWG